MLRYYLQEMRIRQWTKNLFVFASLLFGGYFFDKDKLFVAFCIFLAFCCVSSGVYFVNDICDKNNDKNNIRKKNRPIASGSISVLNGGIFAVALDFCGCFLAWYFGGLISFLLVLSYVVLNLAYSLELKDCVIVDVLIVAYGFVARAVAGAVAINIGFTTWFALCVMFLSLFLALGKRRNELALLQNQDLAKARPVLRFYSLELIDQLMTIVTSALVICYSLFTVDIHTKNSYLLSLTIPLVLYGLFYYLYFVRVKNGGEAPDEALYKEKPILIDVLFYIVVIFLARNF